MLVSITLVKGHEASCFFWGGGVGVSVVVVVTFAVLNKILEKKGIAVFFPTLKTKRSQLSPNSQPNSPTNIDNAKS